MGCGEGGMGRGGRGEEVWGWRHVRDDSFCFCSICIEKD